MVFVDLDYKMARPLVAKATLRGANPTFGNSFCPVWTDFGSLLSGGF
jgi:hypothetical protein